jgi:hypothetical protein
MELWHGHGLETSTAQATESWSTLHSWQQLLADTDWLCAGGFSARGRYIGNALHMSLAGTLHRATWRPSIAWARMAARSAPACDRASSDLVPCHLDSTGTQHELVRACGCHHMQCAHAWCMTPPGSEMSAARSRPDRSQPCLACADRSTCVMDAHASLVPTGGTVSAELRTARGRRRAATLGNV